MRSISAQEAEENFATVLQAAKQSPVVVRDGRTELAVVISPDDYAQLRRYKAEKLLALCDDMAAEAASRGLTEEKLEEILAGNPS